MDIMSQAISPSELAEWIMRTPVAWYRRGNHSASLSDVSAQLLQALDGAK